MPTRGQAQRHRLSHDDQGPVTQGRGTVLQLHSAAEEATSWLTQNTRAESEADIHGSNLANFSRRSRKSFRKKKDLMQRAMCIAMMQRLSNQLEKKIII
jgi:hypothetical protein